MPAHRLAIIDPFHPRIIDTLRENIPADWQMLVAEEESEAARARVLKEADVAFVMATHMPRTLLQQAPHLRFIQKLGAGTDRIAVDHCTERGILVARLNAANAIPVAEHTLALMLGAYRNLVRLDAGVRAGRWEKEAARGVNRQIHGKRVGIVGFGAIGRQVARLLAGFEAEIVYFDPVPAPAEVERALGARRLELDELLATSDIVSLHLPLTPETRNLIDAAAIARMKPEALLVNCARGAVVDEAALAEALANGRLMGAAIDAFAEEPPVGSPLLALENTVLTPHTGGGTRDNFAGLVVRAVENTARVFAGQPLPAGDAVNPEALALRG